MKRAFIDALKSPELIIEGGTGLIIILLLLFSKGSLLEYSKSLALIYIILTLMWEILEMRGADKEKTVNIGIRKNSGTSGKGYRFSTDIPAHWARAMGFEPDNRRMK